MSKTVLITGSSTGFGRMTAESLARRGHTVYASMRDTKGRNREIAEELERMADADALDLRVTEMDVTNADSVTRCVQTVLAESGRLDTVVNNAGIAALGPVEAFTTEEVERIYSTNLMGVIRVNREALPHMRKAGSGRLIQVSSIAGRLVIPAMGHYCASKFALEAYSEALHLELQPDGVDVSLIEPGAFPTPILGKMLTPADSARIATYGPLATGETMGEALGAVMNGPDAPDPQQVVDAIVWQVEADQGAVPLRTVVGDDTAPVAQLNAQAQPAQDALLEAFGLATG